MKTVPIKRGNAMHKYLAAFAGTFAVLAPTSAFAWHNQGHMMVAEVAWQHMTAGARCRAVWLLRSNSEYARGLQNPTHIASREALFVNAATWPDRIKAGGSGFHGDGDDANAAGAAAALNVGLSDKLLHKYWHFTDFPVPASTAHPVPAINALERIKTFTLVLRNPSTTRALKAYDLAWVLHLVGDVHQPLHMATQYGLVFPHGSDAGGNNVPVQYPGFHELHGFWDGAPGDSKDSAKVLGISINAAHSLAAAPAAEATISNVDTWGQESYTLAVHDVYAPPVMLQSVAKVTPTSNYASNAKEVSKARVALAGARLAKLLNGALTWPRPGCQ
jgi:hypothetical protein